MFSDFWLILKGEFELVFEIELHAFLFFGDFVPLTPSPIFFFDLFLGIFPPTFLARTFI